jgi:glycerol-3-phosphate acyltransferase PlsY
MVAVVLVLFSYLLGSIPSAYIAGRAVKGIDIRKVGDGNVGAANAYREIGSKSGTAVLVADVGKGAIAVSITSIFASQPVILLAGLGAVAGHNWPLYIRFRGGRGESTAIGVLSVLLPQAMLILLAISAVPFFVTRNTMLVGAILFSPLWFVALLTGASPALVGYSIGLPCLVGLTHFMTTRHLPDETRHTAQYMQ